MLYFRNEKRYDILHLYTSKFQSNAHQMNVMYALLLCVSNNLSSWTLSELSYINEYIFLEIVNERENIETVSIKQNKKSNVRIIKNFKIIIKSEIQSS